jgi:hypothetical protein
MANFGNGVWLIEDSGGWVAGNNPENVNSASFTAEGTDYWVVEYATPKRAPTINLSVEDLPGHFSVDTSMEEGFDMVKITGTYQGTSFTTGTLAKQNMLDKFCRNHSDLSDNPFYYVKRYEANYYELYYDSSRTERKYMKCLVSSYESYIEERVLHFSISIRSCWD